MGKFMMMDERFIGSFFFFLLSCSKSEFIAGPEKCEKQFFRGRAGVSEASLVRKICRRASGRK